MNLLIFVESMLVYRHGPPREAETNKNRFKQIERSNKTNKGEKLMKKTFIKGTVIALMAATALSSLPSLGVSAATVNNSCTQNSNYKAYYSNGTLETGKVILNNKVYTISQIGQLLGIKLPTTAKQVNSNNTVVKNTTPSTKTSSTPTKTTNSTTSTTNVDVKGLPQLPKNYSINVQTSAENKILQLMNEKRVQAGLKPLTIDSTLHQVARYKSNHMIQYNYFDHTTPQGTNWTSWLKTIGYNYTTTGENIAYNTYDPVELFNQWWNSPGHRANMMNPSYTKVGIGVISGNNKFMGTQTFSN
jgi:uncharacterized protein YkwD